MAQNSETNEEIKRICAINRETVHRICSGQVVLNLAIAVKELVENAIDAGATNIDVRLKEYGSEFIEVSDNGLGVEEQNLEALTLKHFTSKLTSFNDLESISTLGFRGEALSSLCALSNLSITTRHKSIEYGHKIEYDSNGHIKQKTKCARQIGTTVTLTNLFSTLPVRHKDFIKNLKREFTKMCQLLYAYCLITEGVRIVCSNQTKKGVRTTIVATQGSKLVKENIICVFGIKQLGTLIEIKLHEPDEKYLEDYGIKWKSTELPFEIEGFISKCSQGSGRSASDRQFYYINSRPCEPTKIIKLVNETYKHFNSSQYPFVFLNIKTSQSQIDVNVTPDKRQVFMEEEKLLLATLKTSLLELFKEFPSTLRLQNTNLSIKTEKENTQKSLSQTLKAWTKSNENMLEKRGVKRPSEQSTQKGTMGFIFEKRVKVEENFSQNLSENDSGSEDEDRLIDKFVKESYNSSDSEPDLSANLGTKPKRNTKFKPVLDKELKESIKEFKNDVDCFKITMNSAKTIDVRDVEVYENKKQSLITESFETKQKTIDSPRAKTIDTRDIQTYERRKQNQEMTENYKNDDFNDENESQILQNNDDIIDETINNFNVEIITKSEPSSQDYKLEIISKTESQNFQNTCRKQNKEIATNNDDVIDETMNNLNVEIITKSEPSSQDLKMEITSKSDSHSQASTSSSSKLINKQNTFVDVDIPDVQSILQKMRLSQEKEILSSQVRFRSELTSKNAETELQRHISKDMFERMEIIGQFNKGFIITKLDQDLFIIDQHASDEKYNFETLQKNTVIQNQKLVVPKLLDLTADNELLLIDNIEIFKKNGFAFDIDETAPPRQKVKLTAMPVSKNWEFGKEAIDELLFMLHEDSATESMRPSGIRAMFASRACRKSVMIGSALTISDMRRLVDHMGQIDQPWNCPHGRPTMRHLINLDLVKIDTDSEEENADSD